MLKKTEHSDSADMNKQYSDVHFIVCVSLNGNQRQCKPAKGVQARKGCARLEGRRLWHRTQRREAAVGSMTSRASGSS